MSRRSPYTMLCSLSLLSLVPTAARADFDVSPGASNGSLNTNAFEDATDSFVSNVRVFHFTLGEDGPFFAQDPGFHPRPGSGIGAGQSLSVSVTSPLLYWNGTGPISFGAAPAGETLTFQNGTPSLTDGATAPAGTLNIATTDVSGEFDHHLGTTLAAPGGAAPADGVYLTTFILHNSGGSLADSPTFWVLFDDNAGEDTVDAATVAVRDQFAPGTNVAGVPEPAGMAVVATGAVTLLRRVRRRRGGA